MTASLLIRKAIPLNWTLQAGEANDFEKVRLVYPFNFPPQEVECAVIIIVLVPATDVFF